MYNKSPSNIQDYTWSSKTNFPLSFEALSVTFLTVTLINDFPVVPC